MYFVDTSVFRSDIRIPNLEEHCLTNELISIEIDRYELECLYTILGVCLTDELISQLELVGGKWKFKTTTPQKFIDLVFGKTYISNNENYSNCNCDFSGCNILKFNGLVTKSKYVNSVGQEVEYLQSSIIAYYIYYNWREIYKTSTEQVGESSLRSSQYSPSEIGWYQKYHKSKRLFWNLTNGCLNNGLVSLYKYLEDHRVDFPNWSGKCLGNEPNAWGLV